MASKVPALVINERDAIMYDMRKSGASLRQIAKHFDVSESTAHRGISRMQERIRDRMALDHAAEARLDLDRMDDLLRSLYPLTKTSKMTTPDGEEVIIPPSMDAVDRVLKIIAQRAKFFGHDKGEGLTINLNGGMGGRAPSTEKAQSKSAEVTPEDEVRELLTVFHDAGIMDKETVAAIQAMLGEKESDIVDAEVVEESDPMDDYDPVALDPVKSTPPSDEPPEVIDDYDEEFPDG